MAGPWVEMSTGIHPSSTTTPATEISVITPPPPATATPILSPLFEGGPPSPRRNVPHCSASRSSRWPPALSRLQNNSRPRPQGPSRRFESEIEGLRLLGAHGDFLFLSPVGRRPGLDRVVPRRESFDRECPVAPRN